MRWFDENSSVEIWSHTFFDKDYVKVTFYEAKEIIFLKSRFNEIMFWWTHTVSWEIGNFILINFSHQICKRNEN